MTEEPQGEPTDSNWVIIILRDPGEDLCNWIHYSGYLFVFSPAPASKESHLIITRRFTVLRSHRWWAWKRFTAIAWSCKDNNFNSRLVLKNKNAQNLQRSRPKVTFKHLHFPFTRRQKSRNYSCKQNFGQETKKKNWCQTPFKNMSI